MNDHLGFGDFLSWMYIHVEIEPGQSKQFGSFLTTLILFASGSKFNHPQDLVLGYIFQASIWGSVF